MFSEKAFCRQIRKKGIPGRGKSVSKGKMTFDNKLHGGNYN